MKAMTFATAVMVSGCVETASVPEDVCHTTATVVDPEETTVVGFSATEAVGRFSSDWSRWTIAWSAIPRDVVLVTTGTLHDAHVVESPGCPDFPQLVVTLDAATTAVNFRSEGQATLTSWDLDARPVMQFRPGDQVATDLSAPLQDAVEARAGDEAILRTWFTSGGDNVDILVDTDANSGREVVECPDLGDSCTVEMGPPPAP